MKKGIQHYKAMYKMKSHEKLVRDWSGNTEEIVINGQIESNLVECEVQTEVSEEKDKGKCEQENKES